MKLLHRIRRPHKAVSTTWTPVTLCAAYGLPKLVVSSDPVIGIIELGGGYNPADIAAAFSRWGLPAPHITDVSVQGATNSPGDDADAEVVLDILWAAGVYSALTGRAAQIRVYFAPNTEDGYAAAYNQSTADKCRAFSMSWGAPEKEWTSTGRAAIDTAAADGRKVGNVGFAASGDNDSSDGDSGNNVDFPAASPNVVGCGGTSKTATGETVWNDGQNGTGGGFSTAYPKPSYQPTIAGGSTRCVPDVAGVADPQTGLEIVLNGSVQTIGGTSGVSPFWSGLHAAVCAANPTLTIDALPALWGHPTSLHDITSGSNGAYKAGPGPDPCTGLGVPTAAVVAALAGTTAPPPVNPPPTNPPPTNPPTAQVEELIGESLRLTWPHGKTVGAVGTITGTCKYNGVPSAETAAMMAANPVTIFGDILAIYQDYRALDPAALVKDTLKLLSDLGLKGLVA